MKNENIKSKFPMRVTEENKGLYHKTVEIQEALYKQGVAWHNVYFDECTPGFECCNNIGDFVRFPSSSISCLDLFLNN